MEKLPENILDSEKEHFGQEFLDFIKESVIEQEKITEFQSSLIGEDQANSYKDKQILMSAIKKFAKLDKLPEKNKLRLRHLMFLVDEFDPFIDRMMYHYEEDPKKKNEHAVAQNIKFKSWKGYIKGLMEELQKFLPDNMIHELWVRNFVFLKPLIYLDEKNKL